MVYLKPLLPYWHYRQDNEEMNGSKPLETLDINKNLKVFQFFSLALKLHCESLNDILYKGLLCLNAVKTNIRRE